MMTFQQILRRWRASTKDPSAIKPGWARLACRLGLDAKTAAPVRGRVTGGLTCLLYPGLGDGDADGAWWSRDMARRPAFARQA
jgi:hypothetical protein